MATESKPERRKQSLYFPSEMVEEIKEAADMHGISVSRVVQRAWHMAKGTIKTYPGVDR